MRLFYRSFKWFIRVTLSIYFKKITIEGRGSIPKNSPLIFTPNHQNAFLDALLVGAFSPIDLHFITRSDVFNRWTKPFLRLLHMIPIYRIRDGFSKLSENQAIFKACERLFAEKKSILIFAEGNHGEHHYLRPLTKGTARLALQAQESLNEDLKIIPVGLNYFHHQQPGTKVILVFGEPIRVSSCLNQYQESKGYGLTTLRDAIAEGMKSTLVIPEKTEDYEERKNGIFTTENEQLSFTDLRNLKNSPTQTHKRLRKKYLSKILNPIPFIVIHKIIHSTDDVVFHSSLKFAMGLFLFPIWWLFGTILIGYFFGIIWASIAVAAMVTTLFFDYR